MDFNSRPREGGDIAGIAMLGEMIDISIHAPAKGATIRQITQNHINRFQFTPPRRGRHIALEAVAKLYISIHAPAKGATASAKLL